VAIEYDKCPSCGATVVKGAMRCTSCGALLTTVDEQKQRIERYRASQKKSSSIGGVIKLIVILAIAGTAWYFFSDQITSFVKTILARL